MFHWNPLTDLAVYKDWLGSVKKVSFPCVAVCSTLLHCVTLCVAVCCSAFHSNPFTYLAVYQDWLSSEKKVPCSRSRSLSHSRMAQLVEFLKSQPATNSPHKSTIYLTFENCSWNMLVADVSDRKLSSIEQHPFPANFSKSDSCCSIKLTF